MPGKMRLEGKHYKEVFDRGRSAKGRFLVAWALPLEGAGRKAGVVVSKRTFHDAVDRNRAKRLIREAFRLEMASLPDSVAWVFVGRRSIEGKKCGDVQEDLRKVAAKLARA